jgi:hypothetical protein
VLWDWDGWDLWERSAVALLAREGQSPEQALGALRAAVAALTRWRPDDDALTDAVHAAFAAPGVAGDAFDVPLSTLTTLESLVWQSVPAERRPASSPSGGTAEVPGWHLWHAAIGRYLAARAFANWIGYYGQGLSTWYNSIAAAYAVLRLAASRLTVARGTELDASMLVEALGEADRLLVHLASAPELAEILDDWEAPR